MSAHLRIAFLTHEPFYPPSGGGSAEAVYLVEELRRRGHEVHLFCPKVADAGEVRRRFGVTLHEFTTWEMGRYTSLRSAKYLAYPFFLKRMVLRAARETTFDLVLSQHAIAAVAAGWLKRALGKPVVMNFLDYLTAFMETWPPYLAPPPLLKRLKHFELSLPRRSQADGVMTVSDVLADYVVETGYPRAKTLPIYYGYDAACFPFIEPSAANTKNPIVVMHGSLDHHHLGPIAEGAIAVVSAQRPETIFRFIGKHTPAVENFFQRVHAHTPQAKLECTGFIPYSEVAQKLADATVGIVPYEESTGVHCAFIAKAVEYLGVGLPAVSVPARSIQRYFKDEPMIRFAEFNGRDFGAKILSWLAEPPETRRRLAPAISRRVSEELDWQVICRKAVDFVEGVHATTYPRKSP